MKHSFLASSKSATSQTIVNPLSDTNQSEQTEGDLDTFISTMKKLYFDDLHTKAKIEEIDQTIWISRQLDQARQ